MTTVIVHREHFPAGDRNHPSAVDVRVLVNSFDTALAAVKAFIAENDPENWDLRITAEDSYAHATNLDATYHHIWIEHVVVSETPTMVLALIRRNRY